MEVPSLPAISSGEPTKNCIGNSSVQTLFVLVKFMYEASKMGHVNRRIWFALLLAIGLFITASSALTSPAQAHAADAQNDSPRPFVSDQLVVKLTADSSETIEDIADRYNVKVVESILESGNIYLLKTKHPRSVLGQMGSDANIEYAELNHILNVPEANPGGQWAWGSNDLTVATEANPGGQWAWGADADEHLDTQYAFDLINHSDKSTGANVTVAVLDTGVQSAHPMLSSHLVAGYDFVDDDADPEEALDGEDTDEDGLIDEAAGHGTHVAGIIRQVVPDVAIMPVRVLDSNGRGNLFLIAEAIKFAADSGADVINLSLGIEYETRFFKHVIDDVIAQGVVVVAAAGNASTKTEQYPAAYKHVIAVTAIDETMDLADFANYGRWVDVAAPGQSIYSAFPVDGYAWWSGTSMATPFVAGTAAAILQLQPDATHGEVMALITSNADDSVRVGNGNRQQIPVLDFEDAVDMD